MPVCEIQKTLNLVVEAVSPDQLCRDNFGASRFRLSSLLESREGAASMSVLIFDSFIHLGFWGVWENTNLGSYASAEAQTCAATPATNC
eukprot:1789609-Amphidinium_carterae.1